MGVDWREIPLETWVGHLKLARTELGEIEARYPLPELAAEASSHQQAGSP
jgi:hypothetical protein